jgi:hypothetical protein
MEKKTSNTDINIDWNIPVKVLLHSSVKRLLLENPMHFHLKNISNPMNWEVFWFAADTYFIQSNKDRKFVCSLCKNAAVKREQVNKLDYALVGWNKG